jgi:hypothetical protein
MVEPAPATVLLGGIAPAAKRLVTSRKSIPDKPRVELSTSLVTTEHLHAVLVTAAGDVVDSQLPRTAAAGAGLPVMSENTGLHLSA